MWTLHFDVNFTKKCKLISCKRAHLVSLCFIRRTGPRPSLKTKKIQVDPESHNHAFEEFEVKTSSKMTTPSNMKKIQVPRSGKLKVGRTVQWRPCLRELEYESEFNDDQVRGRRPPIRSGNWDWSSPTTSPRSWADQICVFFLRATNAYVARKLKEIANVSFSGEMKTECIWIYIVPKVNVTINPFRATFFFWEEESLRSEIEEDCACFVLRGNEDQMY